MRKIADHRTMLVTVFSSSQKALRAIKLSYTCTSHENWYLSSLIYEKTEELQQIGLFVTFQLIRGYFDIMENEKANLSAQNRTEKGGKMTEWWSSLI